MNKHLPTIEKYRNATHHVHVILLQFQKLFLRSNSHLLIIPTVYLSELKYKEVEIWMLFDREYALHLRRIAI